MHNPADLYKCVETVRLNAEDSSGNKAQIGTLITEYEVHRYDDVRNLTLLRAYHISCKQRVVIPSPAIPDFSNPTNAFSGYPAIWQSGMTLNPVAKGDTIQLVDYTPKTLNAAVTSSQNSSSTNDTTVSGQYTAGSSTSVTNSYEVGANLGFFGGAATGGMSGSFGHSTTDSSEASYSAGMAFGRNADVGSSNTMSIKDWGSYGSADALNQSPAWIWGQEYPWNVLQYYYVVKDYVTLPVSVENQLVYQAGEDSYVVPPSDLSLYGISFQSSARWVYAISQPVSPTETIVFTHSAAYWTGSHSIDKTKALKVFLTPADLSLAGPGTGGDGTYTSQPLNLVCLALDPIVEEELSNGAVVGFVPSQFYVDPGASGFGITSGANNLLVTGSGFDAPAVDTPMSAQINGGTPATLNVQFKVISSDIELTLFMKHWKGTATGCVLSFVVNGNAPFTRHVDALEAGSGADNVSTIILRNKDYTSAEFYDYLVLGLNTIAITISPSADPSAAQASCQYVIRALAVN